jgi:hypothetical protein
LNTLFYSRILVDTQKIFKKYDIKYIYIDDSMKNGKVWSREDQGLLFLLKNSEIFKNIYNSQNIEVWEYRPIE